MKKLSIFLLVAFVLGAVPLSAQDKKTNKDKKTKPAKKDPTKKDKAKNKKGAKSKSAKPKSAKPKPTKKAKKGKEEVAAGHSNHGEAFNEGPRQKAYLMKGTGQVHFAVTTKTKNPNVQKFVEQGIGQLHGFWFFEAERSFRQAAMLDPDCAIAYWGMAMANRNNGKRSKPFIAEAVKRKKNASKREQMYIDALAKYLNSKAKRKPKAKTFAADILKISKTFKDDLEAKAQYGYLVYRSRSQLGLNHAKADKLIKQVHKENPNHPVHHYRIHLWDYKRAANALDSAALCGQAAPAIAHMWHMPGHIYARLKRHADAAWQQEASARVDHAHMMRDRVLPDQIHNFAHNNEWLCRSLTYVGRHRDAISLAQNMIELPRHPRYNTLSKRGSTYYGRLRLFGLLYTFEQWNDLIDYANMTYLEPSNQPKEQVKRLRNLGIAYARTHQFKQADAIVTQLEKRLPKAKKKGKAKSKNKAKSKKVALKAKSPIAQLVSLIRFKPSQKSQKKKTAAKPKGKQKKKSKPKAAPKATKKAKAKPKGKAKPKAKAKGKAKPKPKGKAKPKKGTKPKRRPVKKKKKKVNRLHVQIRQAISSIRGHIAFAEGNYKDAVSRFAKSRDDKLLLARAQVRAGQIAAGLKTAKSQMRSRGKRVVPLANHATILWEAGKQKEAQKAFERLRKLSGHIQLDSPVFERLKPIANSLWYTKSNWKITYKRPKDFGKRPTLDSLGPFRWSPMPASNFVLKDVKDKTHSLKEYQGKPVVVIFYLGFGCLHCAEQLQKFAPMAKAYEKAGINLIAISTDSPGDLQKSHDNYKSKTPFPFPLVSDNKLEIFKKYRAFDDFENIPLHGTFLIDRRGRVRWQDISYEPFMNPSFLLKEAKRLLGQTKIAE